MFHLSLSPKSMNLTICNIITMEMAQFLMFTRIEPNQGSDLVWVVGFSPQSVLLTIPPKHQNPRGIYISHSEVLVFMSR